MITWLASYPRSGNTFFRVLLNQRYGITTFSAHNDLNFDMMPGISDAIGHMKLPGPLEEMDGSGEVYVVKTHDMPPEDLLFDGGLEEAQKDHSGERRAMTSRGGV
jgi:hypothetical protein